MNIGFSIFILLFVFPPIDKRRGSSISDLLFRRNNKLSPREPRLQLLGTKHGARYMNKGQSPPPNAENPANSMEALKTKNAVYCALVLEEFLKELSAISQEHAVFSIMEDICGQRTSLASIS